MNVNYGVIVGRFQVNNLHPGHLDLFHQVSERHDRVIVFVAIPRTISTLRNPLDFETRKRMIQADFPDFTILPLRDEKSDVYWSERLDDSIASVTLHTENVTLYGGRDSFIPKYFGVHKVVELDISSPISGTEIREKASNRIMQSADFRTGVIYAATNQFPRMLSTVDIAICQRKSDHDPVFRVLLGRKPGEMYYRFVGGFVNSGETLESAARREAYEETKADVYSLEYLKSFVIDDWRYRQDTDAKITTSFFIGWTPTQAVKASDDIEEVHWFESDSLPVVVEEAHMPLLEELKKYLKTRFQHLSGVSNESL